MVMLRGWELLQHICFYLCLFSFNEEGSMKIKLSHLAKQSGEYHLHTDLQL